MENAPTVEVTSSCSFGISVNSFNLHVENRGNTPLPPYDLVLYHPSCGSLQVFERKETSERLPGQKDTFAFNYNAMIAGAEHNFGWLLTHLTVSPQSHREMSEEEFGQWKLRLCQGQSENVVLFQDARAGAAAAEILRDIVRSGRINPSGEQMWRARATNSWHVKFQGMLYKTRARAESWWNSFRSRWRRQQAGAHAVPGTGPIPPPPANPR